MATPFAEEVRHHRSSAARGGVEGDDQARALGQEGANAAHLPRSEIFSFSFSPFSFDFFTRHVAIN
jgi:hypothetical protein